MKKIVLLLIIISTFASCKSKKNSTNSKADIMLLNSVLENYSNNSFNKKTVKASLKIKYEGEKYIPPFNASLRIEKDKVIWMSISKYITLGKLKITTDNVQYYNTLDKTYFDGDFSLLSNLLGTEVNFEQLQNMLLGQAIYNLNKDDYQIKTDGDSYVFTPLKNDERFNIFFWLDSNSYKAKKQEIHQNDGSKLLSVQFTAYENIDNVDFPKHLYILAKDQKKKSTIDIDYKSVKFNLDLKFPFSIPNGYKEIKL